MKLLIILIGLIVIGFLVVIFFRGAGILNYLYDVGSERNLNKTKEKKKDLDKCSRDHDEEFEAGQRHCRECGKYLFE